MMSSFSPLGALSDSILVTKPNLYFPVASSKVSIVCWVAPLGVFLFSIITQTAEKQVAVHRYSVVSHSAMGLVLPDWSHLPA